MMGRNSASASLPNAPSDLYAEAAPTEHGQFLQVRGTEGGKTSSTNSGQLVSRSLRSGAPAIAVNRGDWTRSDKDVVNTVTLRTRQRNKTKYTYLPSSERPP